MEEEERKMEARGRGKVKWRQRGGEEERELVDNEKGR